MSVDLDEVRALLPSWGLPIDAQLLALTGGTNSAVFRVAGHRTRWVLRVILNHQDDARLRLETEIVCALQQSGLPFVVPAPQPTTAGVRHVRRGGMLANCGRTSPASIRGR